MEVTGWRAMAMSWMSMTMSPTENSPVAVRMKIRAYRPKNTRFRAARRQASIPCQ